MLTLNQAFYGRHSEKGYRMFASSAPQHNATIERLCAAIGTPDGSSNVEPFYINFIENGYRYMISCCIGNPDDAGRKTLFFHAFFGNHEELKKSGIGIGTLVQEQLFKTQYEPGPVLPVAIEDSNYTLPWGKTSLTWNNDKLAIGSNKPELSVITGILKNNIDSVSWASFSFRPLNDFQLYIISKFVSFPQDRKCTSLDGEILSQPVKRSNAPASSGKVEIKSRKKGKFGLFLTISILINIVLLGVIFLCPAKVKVVKEEVPGPERIVYREVPAKGSTTRAQVLSELRTEFEKRYSRFNRSWQEEMAADPVLNRQYSQYGKIALKKAEGYINFVHEFIFENKEK